MGIVEPGPLLLRVANVHVMTGIIIFYQLVTDSSRLEWLNFADS